MPRSFKPDQAALETRRFVARSLLAISAQLREAVDCTPVTTADLAAIARAERARAIAVGAAGRKQAARERGDNEAARLAQGQEHASLATAQDVDAKLAGDRQARGDQRWAAKALEETLALEEARGETVTRRDGGGVRIKSRDGLQTLAFPDQGAPGLTDVQYRAGLAYRALFDASLPDFPSQMGGLQGAQAAVAFDPDKKTRAQRRAEALARLKTLDAKIAAKLRDMMPTTMLREVAGAGRTIRSLRSTSSGREKAATALKSALDVAAEHFGLR